MAPPRKRMYAAVVWRTGPLRQVRRAKGEEEKNMKIIIAESSDLPHHHVDSRVIEPCVLVKGSSMDTAAG